MRACRSRIAVAGSTLLGAAVTFAAQAPAKAAEPARVMRYLSTLEAQAGKACYGLVLEERGGLPTAVLNLGTLDAELCVPRDEAPEPAARLRHALEVAQAAWRTGAPPAGATEPLAERELPQRVLPPVKIGRRELDDGSRVIVGAGLNFRLHREEVGHDADDLLLFPKPVVPTAAYAPLPRGARIGVSPPEPVRLLDYEVELGFVLLQDLDLRAPPPPRQRLLREIAFFTANDVSDREPIFQDPDFGYARAKSHPGYLPIGPWLVRGDALDPLAGGVGSHDLSLSVTVRETDGSNTVRQAERSGSMIRGPLQILAILQQRYQQGQTLCMLDADGEPRYLHDGRGVLPAGSIVLTGTPGGTAVKAPGLLERLRLFVLGSFSVDGARRRFVEENSSAAPRLGYLEPGEWVDTRVTPLGRQRWQVVERLPAQPYGVAMTEPCPARPS